MVVIAGGRIDIEVSPDLRNFNTRLESQLRGAVGVATKVGGLIGVGVGAGMAFQKVIQIGNDYTNTMNTMQSVSGATAEQMTAVGEKAKVLGEQIAGMSASDAAAAMTELAKGGFTVEQSMQAAAGTLQLAAAAGVDAATAATIQSQALQAFGLSADYAAKAADVLANTANASSAEMTDVAQGLQQAGSVANQFGLTIEDTSAALGMLSNAGIQGSDAGTLIKSSLLALTDQGKPAQAAIEELGLTVYDAQGKFVGLSALFGQLDKAAESMTDEQYQAATATLFGSDAMRLAGIAAQQGAVGFDTMLAAVNKQGAAAEVAAAKTKGLPGAIDAVVASAETMAIELYQLIDGPLEDFARGAADKVSGATDDIVGGLTSVGSAMKPVVGFVGGAVEAFRSLPGPVQAVTAALVALRVTGAGAALTGAFTTAGSAARAFATQATSIATATGRVAQVAGVGATTLGRFGSSIQALGAHAPMIGRMQTSFLNAAAGAERFGRLAGTAAAAGSAMRTAAGGLVSALGGPWVLAIAAAGVSIYGMYQEAKKATAQQDAITASSRSVAIAQRDMAKAFQESKGAISDNVMSTLGMQLQTVREEADNLSKTAPGAFSVFTGGYQDIKGWFSGVAEAGTDAVRAQREVADSGSRTKASFDELKMSTEQIGAAIGGSEGQFNDLVAALGRTSYGGGEAITKVRELREQFVQAQQTAANTTPGFFDLAHAVTVLADESASASDQVNAMKTALDVLSGKPVALSDALQQYNQQVRDTAAATQQAWDASQGWGNALVGADGSINTATANGDRLKTAIDGIRDSTLTAAVAGADMGPIWASNEDQFRQLAAATGLTVDQVRNLSIAAGLVPERVTMLAALEGAEDTEAKLAALAAMLQGVGQPVDVPVGALTDDALNKIREVGGVVETDIEGKPGIVRISAPNQQALDAIHAIQAARDALKDKMVTITIDAVRTAAAQREFNATGQQGPVAPVLGDNATGGRLPGFAGGGRMPARAATDDIYAVTPGGVPIAMVNGDEWVINDKSSDKYDKELAMINAGTFPKLPGFAEGGRIAVDRTVDFLKGESGQEYQYGGVGSPSWDCSGYVSAAYAMLKGLDPNTRHFTTESDFAALGFKPGLGPSSALNIGVHNGGGGQYSHMAGTLNGVPFESGSNGVRYGSGAAGADDPQFENHYHLPAESFNPPGDGSGSSGSYTTKVTWTEKDDLNLQSAVVAVTQAKEDLAATQAKFNEGKKSQADLDQAELKVQKAEQKVRDLEEKRDTPGESKKGPAPQAEDLTAHYSETELDQRALDRAVETANVRRNEVYADPDSTPSDRAEADDALQKARDAQKEGPAKKDEKSDSKFTAADPVDLLGNVAKSFVTGQLNDALGVFGLDSGLGATGALATGAFNLATEMQGSQADKDKAKTAKPTFSKEELAKQGPVTPGTEGWIEELMKTLTPLNTIPAVLRDSGGALPNGMAALNLSGEEEWVLTGQQKADYMQNLALMRAGASAAPGGGSGSQDSRTFNETVEYHVTDINEAMRRERVRRQQESLTFNRR